MAKKKDKQQDAALKQQDAKNKQQDAALKQQAAQNEQQDAALEQQAAQNKQQDAKIEQQDAALKKNKDLDNMQTFNIVKNAEKIKNLQEDAFDDFRAHRAKDEELDSDIEMNEYFDRVREKSLRQEMNIKFAVAALIGIAAIVVAVVL